MAEGWGKIIQKDTGQVYAEVAISPATTSKKGCGTCRFWECAVPRDRVAGFASGACRRHAPVRDPGADAYRFLQTALWPNTTRTDWCGDWEFMSPQQVNEYDDAAGDLSPQEATIDG